MVADEPHAIVCDSSTRPMHGLNRSRVLREALSELFGRRHARWQHVSGTLVVETADRPWSHPRVHELLGQRRVPTFAASALVRMYEQPQPHTLAPLGPPRRPVLAPDFDFIETRGYEELRRSLLANEDVPWRNKTRTLAFRGSSTGAWDVRVYALNASQRIALALLGTSRSPAWDVALANAVQLSSPVRRAVRRLGLVKGPLNRSMLLKSIAVFDVDGNSNSWQGCFWKL